MNGSRKVVGVAVATVAAVTAFAAAAEAAPVGARQASPPLVTVKETDFGIALSRTRVPAGKVMFVAANDGKAPHELVILRTSRDAAALGSAAKISESGRVAESGDLRAGVARAVTVRLTPGHYALVCNLPGHYAAGMHANFTVR